MGGRSLAELPGAGERGDKGSLRGMRGGERFYSQGRRPSRVFPHKEESAGYSGGWCPRAPCRYLLGPGCRGSVPGSLASLQNLSVAFFRGMPQHARPFNLLVQCWIFLVILFYFILYNENIQAYYRKVKKNTENHQGEKKSFVIFHSKINNIHVYIHLM